MISNSLKTEELGDGVTATTDWRDGRCECEFSVYGDLVARAYVDDKGEARVDFGERLHLGLEGFRRALHVVVLAWSRAEVLSALMRQQSVPS